MLHMDVDVRSPLSPRTSFNSRPYRHHSMSSAKRARSPETSTIIDRPAKRMLIGSHGSAMDSAEFSDSSFNLLPSNPSSRFPSEDWVRQTGGLRIGNATPYDSRSTNSSFEHLEMQRDVEMDSEDGLDGPNAQTASYFPSTNRVDISESRPHSNLANRFLSSKATHPEINVTPATPTSTAGSLSNSTQDLSDLRSAASPMDSSMMSITPTQSFTQALAPSVTRKPKFSMGPRADCEKCRLGVKGHWAHFD